MPKGYWIVHIEVHNLDGYKKYIEENVGAMTKYGAKYLVRGGKAERMEGDDLGSRHVVLEFKDLETARACYNSPEYQKALMLRLANSTGHLVIVEGHE